MHAHTRIIAVNAELQIILNFSIKKERGTPHSFFHPAGVNNSEFRIPNYYAIFTNVITAPFAVSSVVLPVPKAYSPTVSPAASVTNPCAL